MHKIIVITGPTAVGKTKLSIELAKKYDGEIINADAVQVYKGLFLLLEWVFYFCFECLLFFHGNLFDSDRWNISGCSGRLSNL